MSRHFKFLKNQFIEEGGNGRLIELEEKVSKEQRAIDPQKFIIHKLIVDILPPPHRSSRISYPPERYIGMLIEDIEKIFLMKDRGHGDDPNTFDEVMFDIDSEKWLDAMKSEINLMHSNQVWTLMDPLEDIVSIRYK